jgi:hypothetical protein
MSRLHKYSASHFLLSLVIGGITGFLAFRLFLNADPFLGGNSDDVIAVVFCMCFPISIFIGALSGEISGMIGFSVRPGLAAALVGSLLGSVAGVAVLYAAVWLWIVN